MKNNNIKQIIKEIIKQQVQTIPHEFAKKQCIKKLQKIKKLCINVFDKLVKYNIIDKYYPNKIKTNTSRSFDCTIFKGSFDMLVLAPFRIRRIYNNIQFYIKYGLSTSYNCQIFIGADNYYKSIILHNQLNKQEIKQFQTILDN